MIIQELIYKWCCMEYEELTLSNPWKRIGAYLIDSSLVSIMVFIVLFLIGKGDELMQISNAADLANLEQYLNSFSSLFSTIFIIQTLLGIVYFGFYQAMSNGQTLGKKLLHIKIVMTNGEEFTSLIAIFRFIINSILLNVCGPLGIIPFFTAHKQGLHDLIVKTVVVDESEQ